MAIFLGVAREEAIIDFICEVMIGEAQICEWL